MHLRAEGQDPRLFSTITTFGSPRDVTLDEIAVEMYYPTDPASTANFEAGTGSAGALEPERFRKFLPG